jgi:hypothetical protein
MCVITKVGTHAQQWFNGERGIHAKNAKGGTYRDVIGGVDGHF